MSHPRNPLLLSFKLRKKHNDYFILKSRCFLTVGEKIIESNECIVISIMKPSLKYGDPCDTPYWRI